MCMNDSHSANKQMCRSLEANQLTGGIPDVLGLMQALVIL